VVKTHFTVADYCTVLLKRSKN